MRLFENASYPFIQWRKRAYIVTGILFALAIGAIPNYLINRYWTWHQTGKNRLWGEVVPVPAGFAFIGRYKKIKEVFASYFFSFISGSFQQIVVDEGS